MNHIRLLLAQQFDFTIRKSCHMHSYQLLINKPQSIKIRYWSAFGWGTMTHHWSGPYHTYIHTYIHTCAHTHMQVSKGFSLSEHTHTALLFLKSVCMCVCVCVCVRVCVRACFWKCVWKMCDVWCVMCDVWWIPLALCSASCEVSCRCVCIRKPCNLDSVTSLRKSLSDTVYGACGARQNLCVRVCVQPIHHTSYIIHHT